MSFQEDIQIDVNSLDYEWEVPEISLSQIKSRVAYDPVTGLFIRTTGHGGNTPGQHAGSYDKNGYVVISLFGKQYKAHRLAWIWVYGVIPKLGIDHIDTIPSNNAITNLRVANQSQNMFNTSLRSTNTSGYKGVSWSKRDKKWVAHAMVDGISINLGRSSNKEEAYALYCNFAKNRHKTYAHTSVLGGCL